MLDEAAVEAQTVRHSLRAHMCSYAAQRHALRPSVRTRLLQSLQASMEAGDAPPAARGCVREAVHVRLSGLPAALDPRACPLRPPLSRLGCGQLRQLMAVTGTVVRTG